MQGYVMAINNARSYIYIQTPYLLPTEPVLTALQTAALAGVDVRVMIPKRGDSWLIHKGTMSYIDDMLEAGVKVYLYKAGFYIPNSWSVTMRYPLLAQPIWISGVLNIILKPMPSFMTKKRHWL